MGGYFVDVCMQYPSVWTHLQRPGICVQISRRFVTNILLTRCTAVTRYVPHIPGNISINVADGGMLINLPEKLTKTRVPFSSAPTVLYRLMPA